MHLRRIERIAPFVITLCATSPALASAQAPQLPVLPDTAAAGTGRVDACTFGRLHGSARCGVFRVPSVRGGEDDGRTIDIGFVILDATERPSRDRDAIIMLPGGPGQAFVDDAAAISRTMPALRRTRDILLVDVRGTGRSATLSCGVPYPRGSASRFGAVFPLDHVAACRDTLSRDVRLADYTTAAAVDDLEALRRWLGYGRLNLMGGSYGTRVAQIYMRRHPDAVRTAVLNGVAPVDEPLYVQHAALLQRALERLLAECREDRHCAAAYPDLDDRLERVLERFREGPVELEVQGRRVAFSAGDLGYALRGLLYGRAADVPRLIHDAADGVITPLAEYYLERTASFGAPDGNTGYHFSVLCAEDIAPLTDDDVERATRGTFLGDHLIENYRALCRIWPHASLPASHWTPVRSNVPVLLLSGERDPVTPPESADRVAAGLPNSRHVVVPGGGHGVGGECVQRMIDRVIITGSVAGVDDSCIEAVPRTRFTAPGPRR